MGGGGTCDVSWYKMYQRRKVMYEKRSKFVNGRNAVDVQWYFITVYKNIRGNIKLGMGIWLVPVIEYYFEGLRGEEQKNEGRNMRVSSKVDIEYSVKRSRAGGF